MLRYMKPGAGGGLNSTLTLQYVEGAIGIIAGFRMDLGRPGVHQTSPAFTQPAERQSLPIRVLVLSLFLPSSLPSSVMEGCTLTMALPPSEGSAYLSPTHQCNMYYSDFQLAVIALVMNLDDVTGGGWPGNNSPVGVAWLDHTCLQTMP